MEVRRINNLLTLLLKVIFLLSIGFASSAIAQTMQFSVLNNSVSTLNSVSGTSAAVAGVVAPTTTVDANWRAEYGSDIVIIPTGDIATPIVVSPSVTLVSGVYGRVNVANGKVSAATRVPVTKFTPSRSSYNIRPTLYISLCGASAPISADGRGNCDFQASLDSEIRMRGLNAAYEKQHQFKHFEVDWDTHKPIKHQVDDLSAVVNDFLNARQYAWDVVIIGFSRGGIFAHELTEKISGNTKINNLHTYLLDPTGAIALNDFYPVSLNVISPASFYGHLYYDTQTMDVPPFGSGTVSDMPIDGYTSHIINSAHSRFLTDWFAIPEGATKAFNDVVNSKNMGNFPVTGASGMEVIRVTYPTSMTFDGTVDITNNSIHIDGSLNIPEIPGANASFNVYVGPKRIETAVALAFVAAHTIITEDQAAVSASIGVAGISAQINGEGISGSASILNYEVSVSVGWDGSINIDLGSLGDLSIDITQSINNVGNALNDAGNWIADRFGW